MHSSMKTNILKKNNPVLNIFLSWFLNSIDASLLQASNWTACFHTQAVLHASTCKLNCMLLHASCIACFHMRAALHASICKLNCMLSHASLTTCFYMRAALHASTCKLHSVRTKSDMGSVELTSHLTLPFPSEVHMLLKTIRPGIIFIVPLMLPEAQSASSQSDGSSWLIGQLWNHEDRCCPSRTC